jgi:hypothetical protein
MRSSGGSGNAERIEESLTQPGIYEFLAATMRHIVGGNQKANQ